MEIETTGSHARATDDEPGLDGDLHRSIFRRHAAGVVVVTLAGPTGPVGFTATSVISVSATPPMLAFSITDASSSWPALSTAETVTLNFLAAGQANLAARFATPGIDRFATTDWHALPTGEPLLHGTNAWLRAEVRELIPAGSSHLIVLRALTGGSPPPDADPLIYLDRVYSRVRHDR